MYRLYCQVTVIAKFIIRISEVKRNRPRYSLSGVSLKLTLTDNCPQPIGIRVSCNTRRFRGRFAKRPADFAEDSQKDRSAGDRLRRVVADNLPPALDLAL